MELKKSLLENGLVVDNSYLEKYVKLILNNLSTKPCKGKTQKHHIVPKYYFRSKEIAIQEKDNLVNLLYKDHILAHYYLSLCSKTKYYMFSNLSALKYLLGRNKELIASPNFLEQLPELQNLYEQYNQDRKQLIDLTGVNKTKIWMHNQSENRRVLPQDIDHFKTLGFIEGSVHHDTKKKVWVNNELIEKMIPEDILTAFLTTNSDYKLGRKKQSKPRIYVRRKETSSTLNKIGIHKEKINKYVAKSDLDTYLNAGWATGIVGAVDKKGFKPSFSARQKIKLSQQNRMWIHQGTVNKKIKKEDLNKYIEDGFCVGRYSADRSKYANKIKRIWITKDGVNKAINCKDLNLYLGDGWTKGRDTTKILMKRLSNNKPGKKGINKGGKYMIKNNVKKHLYGDDIERYKTLGWRFLKDKYE